jgi:hypothetical protein
VGSTRPDKPFQGKLLSWALRLSEYPITALCALAVGCGYESGRPDPDILSHRELCCWGGASLAAGQPLPDSGTLALAMLFWLPG